MIIRAVVMLDFSVANDTDVMGFWDNLRWCLESAGVQEAVESNFMDTVVGTMHVGPMSVTEVDE